MECPICYEMYDVLLACDKCHNVICAVCVGKLVTRERVRPTQSNLFTKCPYCRDKEALCVETFIYLQQELGESFYPKFPS